MGRRLPAACETQVLNEDGSVVVGAEILEAQPCKIQYSLVMHRLAGAKRVREPMDVLWNQTVQCQPLFRACLGPNVALQSSAECSEPKKQVRSRGGIFKFELCSRSSTTIYNHQQPSTTLDQPLTNSQPTITNTKDAEIWPRHIWHPWRDRTPFSHEISTSKASRFSATWGL